MQYQKPKSVSKDMFVKGPQLQKKVLSTLKTCADMVGATLGPGGMPVLIERQEVGLPPMVTKDGVTVFRHLGFNDSTSQLIMESVRDAAVRTANEAGDGTTTATVLAEAITRKISEYCQANPKISPQRVVRTLEDAFRWYVEPTIKQNSIPADSTTQEGLNILKSVAKVSANGDTALAEAVMECFRLVGDDGNVTIMELPGESHYEAEKIDGYPIPIGYEDCCGPFYQKFINDPAAQVCYLERPVFILYHGPINQTQTAVLLLERIGDAWQNQGYAHNVVLVATKFSEAALADFAVNFLDAHSINVYPLLAPLSAMRTGQYEFLKDLSALTGAKIFDGLDFPLERAELNELGGGVTAFEAGRFRSAIIGRNDEILVLERVDNLQKQIQAESGELEKALVQERIGKLTGGIAKLKVFGSSFGETREKRDRAEDAVCGVRGTINHGALPGGGWTLLKIAREINLVEHSLQTEILKQVLAPALKETAALIFSNSGHTTEEVDTIIGKITESMRNSKTVYDALEGKYVDALEGGILDSVPAVRVAIQTSLSIASQLGTCGGTVAFKRDLEVERTEARDTAEWIRSANVNEADERA